MNVSTAIAVPLTHPLRPLDDMGRRIRRGSPSASDAVAGRRYRAAGGFGDHRQVGRLPCWLAMVGGTVTGLADWGGNGSRGAYGGGTGPRGDVGWMRRRLLRGSTLSTEMGKGAGSSVKCCGHYPMLLGSTWPGLWERQ